MNTTMKDKQETQITTTKTISAHNEHYNTEPKGDISKERNKDNNKKQKENRKHNRTIARTLIINTKEKHKRHKRKTIFKT